MIDLNKLSDSELEAIANNDLESLSDSTLELISKSGSSFNDFPLIKSVNPIDANFARQDQRMEGRSDLLKGINPLDVLGARGAIGGLRAGAQLMGGLSQRATAAGVNPLIAAQRAGSLGGMFNQLLNPMQYGEQIKRGLTGEQLGELGDVYVGAGMGENSAALAGLGTELMLTAPEAIVKAPQAIKNLPKAATAFGEFVKGNSPKALADLFSETSRLEMLNDFRKTAYSKKSEAIKKFGKELADLEIEFPSRKINALDSINDLKTMADADPRVGNFINQVPKLKKILEDGTDLSSLPLKDVQDIQNYIQGKLPKGVYAGGPHPLSPIADFLTDLRGDKLKAFPELAKANSEYAPIAKSFKLIKGKLSENALEDFIRSGFQNTEIKKAVKTLFGNSEASLKRAQNFATAKNIKKTIGYGSVGGGALAAFLKFLSKN